ncbi:MAG: zinc ABC transporter substrate-binding protein [Alcanivoracaceae bacterium]|nr:zinc ABC transporter substrate-binding protein [Alcanivoracaceae bacterium]
MRTLFFCLLLVSPLLSAKPLLVASIEPLSLALREIYGDAVTVETLMLPQQTPHQAAFTPGQARLVQQADLLVWLGPASEPALAGLVSRRRGARLALEQVDGIVRLAASGEDTHAGHGHDALADDPHLWLSPPNMVRLADALMQVSPAAPQSHRDDFVATLETTATSIEERLAGFHDVPWLSAHDPWRYFHQHFGLRQPAIISPGASSGASARRFARLAETMAAQQVHCAIAEPEAGRALMERLCRAPDCHIEALDPLARDGHYRSYTQFLARLGEGFARCLDSSRPR